MLTRRKFLGHGCALGMASTTLTSSLLQLGMARRAAAATDGEYRALVCILLAGGNDSYNMVVPQDNDQYAEYAAIRADLALPQSSLLSLSGTTGTGRSYAVHPGMPEVQSLYDSGELAIVANVGTLLEPFDATAFANGSAELPLGLFSHSDQIAQWQTALPNDRVAQGWGGRIADLLVGANPSNGTFINISLSGTNLFQSGSLVPEYSIQAQGDGATGINSYGDGTEFGDLRKTLIDGLLAESAENIFAREYRARLRNAIDNQQVFVEAMQLAPQLASTFSANNFSQSLRQIARTISVRSALDVGCQTFFVTVGGWDHHDEVLDNQAAMLPMISAGLEEFRNALVELNVFSQVTTFTTSDFGRTLTSNGKGSDHGWGGHHLVMGGAVNGGAIFGEYPEIYANNPLDVGRGVYAPTTSVDEYFAELALWFGVPVADLSMILPNVSRFYSPGSGSPPLGLLPLT